MIYSSNPQEIAEVFRRDGIVVLEDFYPADQMRDHAAELDAQVAKDPHKAWAGGENYARERETKVQSFLSGEHTPHAWASMADMRLLEITETICGPDFFTGHIAIFSTPRGGCQGWHQDTRSPEPELYLLNRIVFSADVQRAQGPLYYVPGSHLGPDLPRGGNHDELPGQVEACPKAGTLVLMHSRCFHRVGYNETDRPRTQCNCRVRPATAAEGLDAGPVFRSGPWNFATDSAE